MCVTLSLPMTMAEWIEHPSLHPHTIFLEGLSRWGLTGCPVTWIEPLTVSH